MKKTMFLLLLVIFLSLIISVIAHQPRIVNSDGTNIIEPEISKAYYSNLDREPHYYYLNSDQEFNVYINVLIPGTELTHKVSAELSFPTNPIKETLAPRWAILLATLAAPPGLFSTSVS